MDISNGIGGKGQGEAMELGKESMEQHTHTKCQDMRARIDRWYLMRGHLGALSSVEVERERKRNGKWKGKQPLRAAHSFRSLPIAVPFEGRRGRAGIGRRILVPSR